MGMIVSTTVGNVKPARNKLPTGLARVDLKHDCKSKECLAENVFPTREHVYDDILWHPYHLKVERLKS